MSTLSNRADILMETSPASLASESYRALRFNMESFVLAQGIRTVSVTSAGRGEGKTTTVLNLATAYAQIEKKVLLIDADLRNPSIHHTFGAAQSKGLSHYLMNQATLNEIIVQTPVHNLSVIQAGAVPSNPAELLASSAMRQLLEELKQRYDMIFIDSSCVLSLTDGKMVAAQCDGVLLVVEHGKLKRQVAKKVNEELELAKVKLLGVVYNKISAKHAELFLY
ncbi:CpsD/CapB family tyrosine-protein kinase [Paenibacillus sp. RC67]|uniref:CpsD/CapB family tyrosine-protein kinase n=1 Tax=Paenibacillus sp. RC67 TaxID=3039392 RepID=UPI0024AD1803|nr:CpsD/CapB family tyrosine-protein kinase [Paenibacillus sp. RC67]